MNNKNIYGTAATVSGRSGKMKTDVIPDTFSALIFDLDGTLIDSAPDLYHTINHLLKEDGRPALGMEDVKEMIGWGTKELVRKALAATGENPSIDQVEAMLENFLVYYSRHLIDHTTVYPGVMNALETLAAAGAVMGICTNKPSTFTIPILQKLRLDGFFKAVSCSDTVPHKKPDGRHVLECIKQLKTTAETTIMVGDSENDITAAIDAGVRSVCVTFGYAHVPLKEIGADALIDHFDALPQALREIAETSSNA